MTPAELSKVEDVLRSAYADGLAAVQRTDEGPRMPPDLLPGRPPRGTGRPGSKRHRLVPAAAAAAVVAVALVVRLIVSGPAQPGEPIGAVPRHMGYVIAAGEVIPVNLATDTALPPIRIKVPGGPAGAVMSPDGRTIYVATFRGYVVPVDTATRTAGQAIWIGGVPSGMVMSPDGRTGYVLEGPYGVAMVDFATRKTAGFIRIHNASGFESGFALTPDGKTLYVLNRSGSTGSTVTPIDTATRTVLPPIRTGANPATRIAIAPDGSTAYALGFVVPTHSVLGAYDVLTPIRTATNQALPSIKIRNIGIAQLLEISSDSRTAYLGGSDGASAINLIAGRLSWTAKLPANWLYQDRLSPDGLVYAFGLQSGTLYRIRAATGVLDGPPIQTASARWNPDGLYLSPDGTTLYVQSYTVTGPIESARMIQIDSATGQVERAIPMPLPGNLLFGPS